MMEWKGDDEERVKRERRLDWVGHGKAVSGMKRGEGGEHRMKERRKERRRRNEKRERRGKARKGEKER